MANRGPARSQVEVGEATRGAHGRGRGRGRGRADACRSRGALTRPAQRPGPSDSRRRRCARCGQVHGDGCAHGGARRGVRRRPDGRVPPLERGAARARPAGAQGRARHVRRRRLPSAAGTPPCAGRSSSTPPGSTAGSRSRSGVLCRFPGGSRSSSRRGTISCTRSTGGTRFGPCSTRSGTSTFRSRRSSGDSSLVGWVMATPRMRRAAGSTESTHRTLTGFGATVIAPIS